MQALWSWAILGLILLGVEMLSGTFYILWFGIAALCVALLLVLFPTASLSVQLLAFSLLAVVSLVLWKSRYAKEAPRLRVGQSRSDDIGRHGLIVAAVSPQQVGRIAFTLPVMGSREWAAVASEALEAGDEAEVIGIEGNYLRVQKTRS